MTERPQRFALASSRVVTPDGVRGATVVVSGGRIEAVLPLAEAPAGLPPEDLGNLVISPGVIDSHVHINEPGRTDWEGFETATHAAAAGGVTTLVDMPLNSTPVTTTLAALEEKRAAAQGKCWVDVGFHGGLIPGNLEQIQPLLDAGVCGVKAFLCHSGLYDFPAVGEEQLRCALPLLARRGVPLLVHAELMDDDWPARQVRSYQDWQWMRPDHFELHAVELLSRLCEELRAPIHVVHLSSGTSTHTFRSAKNNGLPLSAETCPHYLHFCAEELQDADSRFKCAPPIRRKDDRERLWNSLVAGVIDAIGSDHSPCPPEMKCLESGDWQQAWGGISSLQLTLPIIWACARRRLIPLGRLAEWLSSNPARLVGMEDRKGRIVVGHDADLCVWNPEEQWTVRGAELHHRHKLTPYEGEPLRGRVKRTYVRGRLAYHDGKFPAGPIGQLLRRN